MSWSVGEVAKSAGITVRTLHHYDEIGLLSPTERSGTGYRRYEYADLERLQRILAYRRLGFGLEQSAAMVAAVEKTMEARKMGISLNPQEMFEVFGESDPGRHADEAEQRWGNTEAYRQSRQRTTQYTKDDWLTIKAEAAANLARFAAACSGGLAANSPEAMDAAEEHRQHISRWFYDCGYDIHRGLGEMYVSDERFTANYDREASGLAQYVRDAIAANAGRAGK